MAILPVPFPVFIESERSSTQIPDERLPFPEELSRYMNRTSQLVFCRGSAAITMIAAVFLPLLPGRLFLSDSWLGSTPLWWGLALFIGAIGLRGFVVTKRLLRGRNINETAHRVTTVTIGRISLSRQGGLSYFQGTDESGNVHKFVSQTILDVRPAHSTRDMRTVEPGSVLRMYHLIPCDNGLTSVLNIVDE